MFVEIKLGTKEDKVVVRESKKKVKKAKKIMKGRGIVDEYCPDAELFHVYSTNSIVYNCTMNQTNISKNSNKFYIVQIVELDDKSEIYYYARWGRVG